MEHVRALRGFYGVPTGCSTSMRLEALHLLLVGVFSFIQLDLGPLKVIYSLV